MGESGQGVLFDELFKRFTQEKLRDEGDIRRFLQSIKVEQFTDFEAHALTRLQKRMDELTRDLEPRKRKEDLGKNRQVLEAQDAETFALLSLKKSLLEEESARRRLRRQPG